MKKKTTNLPPEEDLDDVLRPHYDVDYSKARPNRFAGKSHTIIGPVPSGYVPNRKRAVPKSPPNGSPTPQTVVAKRVYLYPHQIKLLARLDKNFSAAVRKLIDNYKS